MKLAEPQRKASSDAYRLVAGDMTADAPRAWQIAELIVDDLAVRGWPIGEVVGSEKVLASKYGVGTNVIRQALRMLEARGLGRMRRGPSGGLIVGQTSRDRLVKTLTRHLRWSGLSNEDVDDAIHAIHKCAQRFADDGVSGRFPDHHRADASLSLVLDALREFNSTSDRFDEFGDSAHQDDKQAIQIALVLLKEVSWERCTSKHYLGSVQQLSERYRVDPRVFVQAARLVADLGVARVRRGRTGGLFLHDPGCATLVRHVHSQMVAQHLRTKDIHKILWILNIIHARRAAERRPATQYFIDAEETVMSVSPEKLSYFWIKLQQEIAFAAAIPALHVFARCFAAFGIRTTLRHSPLYGHEADKLRNATRQVIRAILRGDPHAAEYAQMRCHGLIDDRLNRSIPLQPVH